MRIATKTLDAIANLMREDQGESFRRHFGETIKHAKDPFEPKNEEWRSHLGASVIGNDCARQVWYGFRWAISEKHEGQLLRLFNRGHLEEPRFVALLQMIGCKVWQFDSNGSQFCIRNGYRGHFGGSLDAVAEGVPDFPSSPVLAEFKTHSEKSFSTLVEKGVVLAKWEHFVQQQIYMGYFGLPASLYMATNKNTDALHCEIILFDRNVYSKYCDLSKKIIDSPSPPPKISNNPSWYKCSFCSYKRICHFKAAPAVNCRTCQWSEPADNGQWICRNVLFENKVIPIALQRSGCNFYEVKKCF